MHSNLFWTNFEIVKICRKYISLLLLMVIAWVSTPAHTIHELVADHEAEEDYYCLIHHAGMGVHFDESHADCDILKIDAPSFTEPDKIQLGSVPVVFMEKIVVLGVHYLQNFSFSLLPSRAPPVLA